MAKNENIYQKTLIDAWASFREEEDWAIDSNELQLNNKNMPYWSLQFSTLSGGRQEGVDILTVDNGAMTFCVVPTRGMNIYEAYYNDIRLGWDSPVDEIINPAYINPEADGGQGFLHGFNEFVARCGMENVGAPCEAGPLHGTLSNTPASTLAVSVSLEKPHTISIYGVVRKMGFYLHNLVLETEIITEPGANWIKIRDRVTNMASTADKIQMLYHVNYGAPLLEEGSRLVAPVKWLYPRDPYQTKDVTYWDRYKAPGSTTGGQCMYMELNTDRKGNTMQMLKNSAGDIGILQSYGKKALPYFTQWKNETNLKDGYVTGLEPATNFPNAVTFEHAKKRYVNLRGGQCWNSELTLTVLRDKKEVSATEKKIKAIQGRKKPEINKDPDKKYSAC